MEFIMKRKLVYRILLVFCCLMLVFLVKALAQTPIMVNGEKSVFTYSDYKPFADRPLNVHYYIPKSDHVSLLPVVFVFHGADRGYAELLDAWSKEAEREQFILLLPHFTNEDFPLRDYQEVGVLDKDRNVKDPSLQTSALVDKVFEWVKASLNLETSKYIVYGHSAGGQFVQRFMLFYDSPYVEQAFIGSPGWYTFPDFSLPFSYGVKDIPYVTKETIRKYLAKNIVLQLATGDTIRESYLRKTPEAEAQGRNRYERGNAFYAYISNLAKENNWPCNWTKVEVQGVGHHSIKMGQNAVPLMTSVVERNRFNIHETLNLDLSSNLKWIKRYDKDVAMLAKHDESVSDYSCDVLFVGSSSIKMWRSSMDEDMAPFKVVNRGYGGATIRDILYNYKTVFSNYQPKNIVLYCDNDIAGNPEMDLSIPEVYDLYRVFFQKIHADYPEVPIFFMSIKYSKSREKIRSLQKLQNEMLEAYAEQTDWLTFVDVTSLLMNADGSVNDSLFLEDHLHINHDGYLLWAKRLKSILTK